jgi:hypothetical protein
VLILAFAIGDGVRSRRAHLRAVEQRADGGPPRATRETREYDARKNLSKLATYKWNAETGNYEPFGVSYYTIEYYR